MRKRHGMRRSWFPTMNLGENPGRDYNGCRPRSFCPGMESSCHNGYNTDEDGLTASDVKHFSNPSKSMFSNSGASNERNSLQLSSSKSQAAMALSSVVPSPYTNEKSVLGNSNSLSDLSQYGEFSDPTEDSRRVKIPGLTMDSVKKFTQQGHLRIDAVMLIKEAWKLTSYAVRQRYF
ncbi:unnamed protein product [Calicophoron daubneyi]|uniref:Uncharacterized protein n=1 Tax=Calicophoron daubneyi TaxID=300641 RepID=A0AAV2TW82_CALDB